MLLRISFRGLKCLLMNKNLLNVCVSTHFISKYSHQFSTSTNKGQTSASNHNESIQFPKHLPSLENQSVDKLLSIVGSKSVTAVETVTILKTLRMFALFKNVRPDSFKNDQRFQTLCNIFEKNCSVLYPSLLVSGLRSLLEVGVPSDSSHVISAERSIINNVHLFSPLNLIGCLYFHHKFMETDLQKQVVSVLASELCKRISEVATSAEVLMLVHFLHIFNGDDLKEIQQKVIELIKTLNSHEICKVFVTFSENSCRNILILNALAFHLRTKVETLQIKEILDILYSFKKLNFSDFNLISNFMARVSTEIPTVKQPSIISGLLTACGHLRLRHTDFLNVCSDWIISHIEICRQKEFVSFILAIASLNYYTLQTQRTLQAILPLVTYEKVESPDVWLDVVWSLAMLNIADKDVLLKVLSPSFYKPLIESSDFQNATNKLKLMNLKAVLKNYYPDCVFSCDLFLDPIKVPQSSEIKNSRKHVLKVLSNFVPKDTCLSSSQNTDMGIFIDAEFIMDRSQKPLPLSEFGILSKVTNTKPLPMGAQRIALLILFYKDFTLCSHSRTGFNDLAIRLLFSQGYTAVPIPFHEFIRNSTEIKKAKFLLQKISSIMHKVEENGYKFNIKIFN